MKMLSDVRAFNGKFGVPVYASPQLLSEEDLLFRLRFLAEELHELAIAHGRADLEGVADALVDLVYVALGTALWAGLGEAWPELWAEVQRANMAKVPANVAENSKRGHGADVIKPTGWCPPELAVILQRYKT